MHGKTMKSIQTVANNSLRGQLIKISCFLSKNFGFHLHKLLFRIRTRLDPSGSGWSQGKTFSGCGLKHPRIDLAKKGRIRPDPAGSNLFISSFYYILLLMRIRIRSDPAGSGVFKSDHHKDDKFHIQRKPQPKIYQI